MQVSSINSQNFNGSLIMPTGMQTRLEKDIYRILNHENREISVFSELVRRLFETPSVNIKVFGKSGIKNPVKDVDFDVFIENATQYTHTKIETGTSLAERFLNALYEATK